MQAISSYIEFLLTQSDCVVIPGFGGFILQEQVASFCSNGNILPPSKVASFNPAMHFNDGLLTNLIMVDRGISFSQANNLVETFAKDIVEELKSSRTVEMGTIGSFSMNESQQIVFSPKQTNFDVNSYGFAPIQWDCFSIQQTEVPCYPNQKVHSITLNSNAGSFLLKRVVAIIAVIFTFAIFNSPKMEQSEISEQQATFIELSLVDNISSAFSKSYASYTDTEATSKMEDKTLDTEAVISKASPIKRYYIIISSLPSADLIDNEIIRLRSKGIEEASCLEKDKKFRMYIDCFETKPEAEQYLESFRKKHKDFADAWLLAHRS